MKQEELHELIAAGDAEYEKLHALPHRTRQVIRRLLDAVEGERRHMQSLAKWVGVDESVPSLEIACEVSSALEDAAARVPDACSQDQPADAREVLHARCDCVSDLGPPHCHLCGTARGVAVPWEECSAVRDPSDPRQPGGGDG